MTEETIEPIENEPIEGAEAEVDESTADSAEENTEVKEGDESDNEADDAHPKATGIPKRIGKLTWEKKEAQRSAEFQQRRADLAEEQLKKLQEAKPVESASKPVLDDYDTYEEHQEALVDWKLDQRAAAIESQKSLQTQAEKQAEVQATVESSAAFLVAEGSSLHPDFTQVAGSISPLVMNNDMVMALAESEQGAEVAYHLGKNPAEAAQFQNLNPVQMGRALARLESVLSQKSATKTKVPEPIAPSGSAAAVKKDPAAMTDNEFAKWRRSQIAQRYK